METASNEYLPLQYIAKSAIIKLPRAEYAIALVCSMTDEELRNGLEFFETAYAEYLGKDEKTA